ncbi:trypsin-like peptidase domain-containing protein [Solirubrobacter ginsenosidimutans]|uniref:Trypsin-like peptidase domain-containing protein n=1 Tax=Solirubrobacter ginsenosidimutans TaxID=490573 RepID=A0A9X3MUH7_9ACTN|nr:trypsin-like peptidase domain-containing protein [Solirubrobacter ginsenosidimutans]
MAYGRRRAPVTPAVALAALALITLVAVLLTAGARDGRSTVVERVVAGEGAGQFDVAAIYARANPGIVDVNAHTIATTAGPFGLPEAAEGTESGTGILLNTRGDILTAGHVVAGGHHITVTFDGGASRRATVLGTEGDMDVAVLHVDPSGLELHPLTLGSVAGLRVGDPVAVIGDPFGVPRSLSTGVISGLHRTIEAPSGAAVPNAVQTDAAINPGNSGGPLLDAHARVIGIADQIATGDSSVDSSTGVGFAVPIDSVKTRLAQLERGRHRERRRTHARPAHRTGSSIAT